MTEYDGLIIMIASEQALKFKCCFSEAFDWKSNILDNNGGPDGANRTHGRKQSFADVPQLCIFVHHIRKFKRAFCFYIFQ